jgi:hypothetical protein
LTLLYFFFVTEFSQSRVGDNFGAQRGATKFSERKTPNTLKKEPELTRGNMSGTPKQMVELETIKTALKKLNYPIPAELTNMLRDQMIDIETFETLWKRLSPPTVEEACSLPTFASLDHEDPKKFITECKNILANSNPAYWRDQIAAQFRLEPARWWSYEAPYAPSLHDLEQSLIERYENFEILTKLRMKFYEIPQAVGESADVFITKKKPLATRIAPHITKAEFNGFCRMWLRDGHHLLEEPRHAANDVVPSAPFVGEPAPRHHERPHQQRDQQPVEHLTRFNEEDAAGVPPQEAGGPRHAQDVHRDRCTQPLLEHERREATTAVGRPEDVRTELIDQKRDGDLETPNAVQHPQQELPQPRHLVDHHVPFAGGPNQGHHQRPQHPPDPVPERAQGPGGAYLDENDAANDMTAGDAAEEFPPQKTGDLLHSQELIEDREPDLQTGRNVEHAGQVDIEPIGDRESYQRAQPPLKPEREEMTTVGPPQGDAPAVSAERFGKKLDDDLQLPPAETTAEKHRQRQGKLALSAALPSEPGPVSDQLPKVVAVISTRPHRADRQQHLDHHNHNTTHHLDGVNHDS